MTLDRLTNLIIVLFTAGICISYFRKDGAWNRASGRKAFRFFTTLSNVFCALSALCVLITRSGTGFPYWAWFLKYLGTSTVTVTFLTVMFFLGPAVGYGKMLKGDSFYMHLVGPLLAILSFCFLERQYDLSIPLSLTAMIPVILYGAVYLWKVVFAGSWEDFYGYNRSGKWPLSFAAMVIASILISLLLRFLYRL